MERVLSGPAVWLPRRDLNARLSELRQRRCPNSATVSAMRMLADYLEHVRQFERIAADETLPQLKAAFEKQAAAYRKLVTERAKKLGLELLPHASPSSDTFLGRKTHEPFPKLEDE
jgi:hypothetical protein